MGRSFLLLFLLLPSLLSISIHRQHNKVSLIQWENTLTSLKIAPRDSSFNCILCGAVVEAIDELLKEQTAEQEINQFLKDVCNSLNLERPHVCNRLVESFTNELYFVFERSLLSPNELCSILIKDCGSTIDPFADMWNISIPAGKPPVKPWPVVTNGQKKLRVLHLSDIHIDREYTEGSEADCMDENWIELFALCCRNFAPSTRTNVTKTPAGHWGSHTNCDIPYRTFENAMKHISQTHKDLDYIMITGDKEAHDCWDYTKQLTQTNLENITDTLLKYFPNTKIYESVGNHEGVPQDSMAPHSMEEYETRGPQWLYSILSKTWSNWISQEAVNDVQYRASYVEHPAPGLKLISINTIYCSSFNFYLYVDQRDPDGTLEWMIDELLDSESKGEKVHLIGHIPPGDNYCLKGWAHNFYEIVNRFENTIAGQFYGHTHQDHFEVYYENSNVNGRPVSFNFITPSLTTYNYNNPAYRIYTIDGGYEGASYTTIDAETYTTDIRSANAQGIEPQWKLEYNMRNEFEMSDLSPSSWNSLINRLQNDDDLFKKFIRFYYRRDDYNIDCWKTPECRKTFICSFKAAKSHEEDLFCSPVSKPNVQS